MNIPSKQNYRERKKVEKTAAKKKYYYSLITPTPAALLQLYKYYFLIMTSIRLLYYSSSHQYCLLPNEHWTIIPPLHTHTHTHFSLKSNALHSLKTTGFTSEKKYIKNPTTLHSVPFPGYLNKAPK